MPFSIMESPLGSLILTSDGQALTALDWCRHVEAGRGAEAGTEQTGEREGLDAILRQAKAELTTYFAGTLTRFTVPVAPHGTAFQHRVWEEMRAIPYGKTRCYGDLARGLASAARAVGGACGRNPIPIIVPCHRVIAARGEGGYSGQGGLEAKRFLLDLERS